MSTASRCTRPAEGLLAALVLFALGAGPAAAAVADHLLLSELVVQTRIEVPAAKYIELVNPTASPIDLSSVYITDATYNSPPIYYYNIVKLAGQGGGGTGGDFLARFPQGASIAAGDTIAVAITGSGDFQTAYGHLPDFELYEEGIAPDAVPELVEAFPGSIGRGLGSGGTNVPDLSSTGESVVLFRWDGQSDLVQDLDYALWGSTSLLSVRVSKTGVRIDGPDAGADSSAYLPDTDVAAQRTISTSVHAYGNSFQRLSADEGTEVATGGNGQTGHNETSEQLNSTWRATALNTPAAAPAAFTAPAPIFTASALQPAAPQAGLAVTASATVVAFDAVTGVTLVWSDNGGATWTETACTSTGLNSWAGQIPARPVDTVVRWYLRAAGSGGGQATKPVAAPIYYQSYTVVAAPEPSDYPPLLLITEVCVLGSPQEFVEIANPTGAAVDLSNYYLTDAIHAPGSQYYWNIVLPNPGQTTVGGGAFTDFHARFPDGATIAAGDTITVSIAGSDAFLTSYGFPPDYELFEDGSGPDDVPDMREVFAGSINGSTVPSLTNTGEIVILYYWNGATDLVTDIDVFAWGAGTSFLFSKTGVSIDGPDAGTTPTAYQADTPTASQQLFSTAHAFGESYQRVDASEGTEIKTGGNGTLGHNETSENVLTTFHVAAASPSPPGGGGGGVSGEIAIEVPARTFLPVLGESFPIRFRSQRGAQTELRIYDLKGQLVVTLFDSRYDGAAASAEGQWTRRDWNGRDRQFEMLPAGLYVAHLSAVDPRTGKEETQTAPVVLATRLSK